MPRHPARVRRRPALPLAAALAVGVFFDALTHLPFWVWLAALGSGLAVSAALLLRSPRETSPLRATWPATIALLPTIAAAGAAAHQLQYTLVSTDQVSAYARHEPRMARIVARVVEFPVVIPRPPDEPAPGPPRFDRTLLVVEALELETAAGPTAVSGRLRVDVVGHLLRVRPGDVATIVGQLSLPGGVRNPGGFDFREVLRARGIHALIRCDLPEAVSITRPAPWSWRDLQAGLRRRCEQTLYASLSERTAPLAVALLLGTRSGIDDDLREAFARTGATHVLAISGANVAILAGLAWLAARFLGFRAAATTALVLVTVAGYVLLADAQPPVLRAACMLAVIAISHAWGRSPSATNALALAALFVLVANPRHLFDLGAQLSFLAVAALIWAARLSRPQDHSHSPFKTPFAERVPLVAPAASFLSDHLRLGTVSTAAIWLFTLPLTTARFHLVSWAGFLLNVLLLPAAVIVLAAGYLLLLSILFCRPLVAPLAAVFDWGLHALIHVVELTSAVPGGAVSFPSPPAWWIAGFYLGMAACWLPEGWRAGLLGRLARAGRRFAGPVPTAPSRTTSPFPARRAAALLAWCAVGLLTPVVRPLVVANPDELRCTFLSVGHGGATLVECPNGRTLLYDAGQLQDDDRAALAIEAALHSRGHTRVDLLLISHADIDHFNAVDELLGRVAVGTVAFSPTFLDFRQTQVAALCDRLAAARIPIRLIGEGDELRLDRSVALRVLAPAPGHRDRRDNANSLTLLVEFASRRLLLTGDLEGPGLGRLLAQPPLRVDVLQAPHHGSLGANPPALADWCQPAAVVIHGGRPDAPQRLAATYGHNTTVLGTPRAGAVMCRISRSGALTVEPFVRPVSARL